MANDSRARAPQGHYGIPGFSYPTPNVEDLIIIEEIPITDANYSPLVPGTPHPVKRTALLVKEEPGRSNDRERSVRRIYATPRAAQEAYNAAVQYAQESSQHPIYIRSYVVKRSEYSPGTYGQPLTSLTGLTLVNGGSGYADPITISFTGTGSGAAAKATVQRGVIVAIQLTQGGTGYTAVPTVTIESAQGSGAVVTAHIQEQGAVLVKEELANVEDGTLSSLFVRVTQVWKTLPGYPLATAARGDAGLIPGKFRVGVQTTTVVQDVAAGTSPSPISSTVLFSQVQATSRWEAQRTDVNVPGTWPTFTGKRIVDGRIANVIESIVTDGAALPTFTTSTWDLDRETLGNGQSLQRLVTTPTLQPRVAYKRTFGGNLEKTITEIVAAGTKPGTTTATELASQVRDVNDWQAQKTTTTLVGPTGSALTAFPLRSVSWKEPRTGVEITRYTQWQTDPAVTLSSLGVSIGSQFPAGSGKYVIEARLEESDDSDKRLLIVESCPLPASRVEYHSKAFPFPGIFEFMWGTYSPATTNAQPPYPGVNYKYTPPRTIEKAAKVFFSYSLDPNADPLPESYRVESPGGASRFFGRFIGSNTIHPPFTVSEDGVTIELIESSNPPSYTATDALIAAADERPWKGRIYERQVWVMSEEGAVADLAIPT